MTDPKLSINPIDSTVAESGQTETSNTEQTQATAVEKLQQATQTTRDINNKLQDLEKSFAHLSSEALAREDDSNDSLQVLRERCQALAGDISHVTVELANFSIQQDQKTAKLSDTFREGLQQLALKLDNAHATLQDHQTRLTATEGHHEQFAKAQQQLKQTAASQAEEINSLRTKILTQTVAFTEFRQENEQQFNIHSDAINELGETDQAQQILLNTLRTDTSALTEASQQHKSSLSEQATAITSHKETTKKKFRWVTAGICVLALGVAGSFTYYQHQHDGQMTQLSSTINQQIQGSDGVNGSITTLKGNMTGLETTTAGLNSRLETLETSLSKLENSITKPEASTLFGLSEPLVTLHNGEWIAAQNARNYTIQLVGVYQHQGMLNYVNQNADSLNSQPLSYSVSERRGNDYYNLLYGNFTSFSEAQKALHTLPAKLQRNGPWIRTIGAVQKTSK